MNYFVLLGITVAIFLIAVVAMSIGVLLSNRSIKGSCGGLANLTDKNGKSICEACTNPSPECRGLSETDEDE
ncbi:MAG: (Na+)-NQR maturation NqrM [Planctomycetaceae bacterium]|nr:(Na+)-NQR maturation NqrM [Planctomycetaceae bacterium]